MKIDYFNRIRIRSGWMLFALVGVVGCTEQEILNVIEDHFERDNSQQSSIDTHHQPLSWEECPDDLESECALLTVPLQWGGIRGKP